MVVHQGRMRSSPARSRAKAAHRPRLVVEPSLPPSDRFNAYQFEGSRPVRHQLQRHRRATALSPDFGSAARSSAKRREAMAPPGIPISPPGNSSRRVGSSFIAFTKDRGKGGLLCIGGLLGGMLTILPDHAKNEKGFFRRSLNLTPKDFGHLWGHGAQARPRGCSNRRGALRTARLPNRSADRMDNRQVGAAPEYLHHAANVARRKSRRGSFEPQGL